MKKARLFACGRDQAVRLPREFRFEGSEVRIRRFGLGVILEPTAIDLDTWFEALDRFEEPFMPEGRDQPQTPVPSIPSVSRSIDPLHPQDKEVKKTHYGPATPP